ncbi:helix-turn-helix domain-containing protein [Streptomyces avermitilis]|uniref:helix-turn-helix domain-containing protein n=1 Tax=Streptomyces avermitilis TaxID=33903 RepID=UPI0033DD5E55
MSRGSRAVDVVLSDEERAELLRRAGGVVAPRLAERARIVLACADGKPITRVAAEFEATADTVRKWRSAHRTGRGGAEPGQGGAERGGRKCAVAGHPGDRRRGSSRGPQPGPGAEAGGTGAGGGRWGAPGGEAVPQPCCRAAAYWAGPRWRYSARAGEQPPVQGAVPGVARVPEASSRRAVSRWGR